LIFAGQSFGYYTKFQNSTYDITAPTRDMYLFKLDTSSVDGCFYNDDIDAATMKARDYWVLNSVYRTTAWSDWYVITRGGTSDF
jgi:hypothetical protein